MKNLKLIVILLLSVAFTNCDQVKLADREAQNLIEQSLNLPKKFSTAVYSADATSLDLLLADGVITGGRVNNNNNRENYIEISDACKQYNLGETTNMGNKDYVFKTYDIEFANIDGISINKENKTALVRFTIKFTNITPFARSLVKSRSWNLKIYRDLDNPIRGELNFRKFDSGWQIDTNLQGYDTLLEKIMEEHRKNN